MVNQIIEAYPTIFEGKNLFEELKSEIFGILGDS